MSINVASYADLLVMIAKLKEENERLKNLADSTYMKAVGEISALQDRVAELEFAAGYLRTCQRAYMLERGNEQLGKAVGEAAIRLDEILKEPANEVI